MQDVNSIQDEYRSFYRDEYDLHAKANIYNITAIGNNPDNQ